MDMVLAIRLTGGKTVLISTVESARWKLGKEEYEHVASGG